MRSLRTRLALSLFLIVLAAVAVVGVGVLKALDDGLRAAALRRAGMQTQSAEPDEDELPLSVHELEIEPAKRAVRVRGEPVELTFVEFEILNALARNPGRVFTRDMLLTRIWGDSAYRDPRTIDVHIRHLREKLETDAKDPEYLFTVRGVGYRFRDEAR